MLEIILDSLKKNNVEEYIITETQTEGVELYCIKKAIDMNRKKKLLNYKVSVFKEIKSGDDTFKGDATVEIYPSMDIEEVDNAIKDSYYAASFVKNKTYNLPKGYKGETVVKSSNLSEMSLEEAALRVKNALYKYDNFEKGFVNSSEVFVNKTTKRILSSKGADASYVKYSMDGEYVTQWVEENDVEVHNTFNYGELDEEDLAQKVKEAILYTGYRDKSKKVPSTGKYDVILSGDDVTELFNYYLVNATTGMVYQKYSNFKVGESVQGTDIKGDKIEITLKSSVPFSNEGIELKDIELIKDNRLQTLYGSFKFADYLGLEPIGSHNGAYIKGGEVSFDDMFKEGNLHILKFSDFQIDTLTGDFGGEIRLALLKDGDKIIPLTGGSLSANIKDVQENIVLSKELQKDDHFELPKAIKFRNVEISGE